MMRLVCILAALTFFCGSIALGESTAATQASTGPSTQPADKSSHPAAAEDKLSVTQHEITINGEKISYDATAGTLQLKDDAGKPWADFFFVAYTKQGADAATRPVTFVFNGGPGAAAVWLHLGAVGPKRIKIGPDGVPGKPPHELVDNPQCWLDLTDLVFIDPVGTGFSRPAEGRKAEDFYGVEQDISSVGQFIRLYITRYQRWGSPKFLAGESYGTTRAAGLSSHLLDRYGIDLNGIVLISTVLNFQTLSPSDGNDLPYVLYLPSYAAIAASYHKLGDVDLQKLLPEVEHYALNEYSQALAKGGALTREDRAAVVDHLARYTGLPAEYIDRANMRIGPTQFREQLLVDQRLILGRFDALVTGYNPTPTNHDEYDPSLSLFLPVYSSTFNEYVRGTLKYDSDLSYEVLNGRVGPWDFGRSGNGYLDVTGDLRSAMLGNPNLKVLVCSGHEDLATPYLATNYTLDHLDPTGHLKANITQAYFESGHMIYHHQAALEKLKQDVTDFYRAALAK